MTSKKNKKIPEQSDLFGGSEPMAAGKDAVDNHASGNADDKPNENTQKEKNIDMTENKKPAKTKKNKESGGVSFEALLERLEEIVEKMECGGLKLDESMKLYEEGVKNAEKLTTKLSEARNRVMKLVEGSSEGPTLESFDGEESL